MNDPTPTLLIFTLGAEEETRRRRLLPARFGGEERELYRSCLDAAVDAGRAAGCRLRISSPKPVEVAGDVSRTTQSGRSFGDRLTHAFDDALTQRGTVVLVGTDVPGLAPEHLRAALDRVAGDPDRVVLGPSPDGGLYLLAASRPIPGLATRVAWCRPRALATLRRLLAELGRPVTLLAPLGDLDHRADLERWLARGAARVGFRRLMTRLRRIVVRLCRPLDPRAPRGVEIGPHFLLPARAPPFRSGL